MAKSRKKKPTKALEASVHVIKRWLNEHITAVGRHSLVLMSEANKTRLSVLDDLHAMVSSHYVDPETTAKKIAALGELKTARSLRELLPTSKTARSGDLGEVLAAEIAEQQLGFKVPIRRLHWKDGRDTALRGDDIIGLTWDRKKLVLLKGESKSRKSLSTAVLKKAGDALDNNRGRPTRHSVHILVNHLWKQGQDELATELEEAALQSFTKMRVEHMLFALTGSDPKKLLTEHLKANSKKKCRRHAIGLRIKDHGQFIKDLFEGI